MLSPRSPPASPSKTRTFFRDLVTGVQPCDTVTHQQRWGKQPKAAAAPSDDVPRRREANPNSRLGPPEQLPPPSPTRPTSSRVASLVHDYEAASLSTSRPYASHAPQQPSPQSIPLPPSPTKPTYASPALSSSTPPTVPASFFQHQQARRTPPASSTPPTAAAGKENRSILSTKVRPSNSELVLSRPSFSPSKPQSRERQRRDSGGEGSSDVSITNSDDGGASSSAGVSSATTNTSGTSATSTYISAEEAIVAPATLEHFRASTPTRVFIGNAPALRGSSTTATPKITHTVATPLPPSRPEPTHRDSSPRRDRQGSSFIEELPVSYPSRQSPPLVATPAFPPHLHPRPTASQNSSYHSNSNSKYEPLPMGPGTTPELPPKQKESSRKSRERASTVGGKALDGRTRVPLNESQRERERRVEEEFVKMIDGMQIPDPSVRRKMLGLSLPVKEQMLSGASPSSSSIRHTRGFSSSTTSPTIRFLLLLLQLPTFHQLLLLNR
ncbi:hypothetical protein P7C70_g7639, partial [Phenoliferia sp. Uapishka_3]